MHYSWDAKTTRTYFDQFKIAFTDNNDNISLYKHISITLFFHMQYIIPRKSRVTLKTIRTMITILPAFPVDVILLSYIEYSALRLISWIANTSSDNAQ